MEKLNNLRVLYVSNNKIKDWSEIERLAALEHLEELLLVGNQLYNEFKDAGDIAPYRIEVQLLDRKCTSSMELLVYAQFEYLSLICHANPELECVV